MSADQWRAPDDWHVTMTSLPAGYVAPERLLRWPHDTVVAVLTTVFVALTGPIVGLIWSATTPKLSIPQVALGLEGPFRSQIGADVRFLVCGAIAGVVCAVALLALRQYGPGAVVGLAVGGLLAALIANQVGVVAQHDGTVAALQRLGLSHGPRAFDVIGFHVRALGVITAWPIAALVVHGLAVALRPTAR